MNKISTMDIIRKYGFRFQKGLGQNFLIDDSILEDIIKCADILPGDEIIEIGPGFGSLTKGLLEKAGKVFAIELDSDLIPILEEELNGYDNLVLLHNDALKVDFNELITDGKNVKIVANLPYYVTTPIIVKLLTGGYKFDTITIMIQKEVAERITSKPSCKAYGALSLFAQYYFKTQLLIKVPPSSFIPEPKVDSMVIKLTRLEEPAVKVLDKELFFKIIRESFNMRRKTLRNSLRNITDDKIKLEKAFSDADIDPIRRGETLSIEEFAKLSNCFYEII
jgi:16S rRNA (adenine1518-N6/adenine1519-N6)-dimethyltransferase